MREVVLPFLSLPTAPWIADTLGFTLAQQGVLIRALVASWREGPLPAAPEKLARALGISRAELTKVRAALDRYFRRIGEHLVCDWIEAEYHRALNSRERKRAGALQTNSRRWGAGVHVAKRSNGGSLSDPLSDALSVSPPSPSTSIDLSERVTTLIRAQPSLSDAEIARQFPRGQLTTKQVAEIRRSHHGAH